IEIEKILLETDYSVIDAEGDNTDDFGKHIQVEFLYNADQMDEVIYETTLAELKDMEPEAVNDEVFDEFLGDGGLEAGETNDLLVRLDLVDNVENRIKFKE